ncbi:glycosyltransferase family 2 protein [Flavobacterium sp. GP15]|uniref:glycosyltransferase family 2 protein n=1 Tax=Flavobacterium sp. GP15 TaxID=2758567 RepID=UPI00165DBDAE|nr:glycosyltransferase family 2 protein [Flavobacterium sp. GP15]
MLAIIIPFYKVTFFEATLQSLADQTDKRFKVYIGNDASPEDCTFLLRKFEGSFDFKYHRFEKNIGRATLTKQWDRCIALSSNEEWLMVLCDDDTLNKDCIAGFYNNMPSIINFRCDVIRFATITYNEKDKLFSSLYTHPKIEKSTDFFYRKLMDQTRSSLSEYIFKRNNYEQHGFKHYSLAWHSDDRAWLEFSGFQNIYTINSSSVSFRISEENISRANYKTEEKINAKVDFYRFFVFKHINKFRRFQRRDILLQYEQLIYKINQVDSIFFCRVIFLFFANFYFLQSIKFTRRVVIYLRKNV